MLKSVNCGFINKADNKLYVALSNERYILKEERTSILATSSMKSYWDIQLSAM
jgi:hypothetical protein